MLSIEREVLKDVLRVEDLEDYPQIEGLLIPAAETVLASAIGEKWMMENASDYALRQAACVLIATWFNRPEAFGELTPGANFLITQLQIRALGGGDGVEGT